MSYQVENSVDEKEVTEAIEPSQLGFVPQAGLQPPVFPGDALITSAYTTTPKLKLVAKFWRLFAIGCAVSLGGMYAGYCLSAVGAIVANPGVFPVAIAGHGKLSSLQASSNSLVLYGTPKPAHSQLNAIYVSLWGGAIYIGQTACQPISPIVGDKFGRRANLWLLTLFMLTVSALRGVINY